MFDPPETTENEIDKRFAGSMLGSAIGGALGSHVEVQSRDYLVAYPVTDFQKADFDDLEEGQVIHLPWMVPFFKWSLTF